MLAPRREPIIEFAGLPGVGKSTLVRSLQVSLPAARGPQLPRAGAAASLAILPAALPLILSLRPFAGNDLNRLVKLLEAHSIYQSGLGAPLLLEQGLLQRLWSCLADRRAFSAARLSTLVEAMAPAAPDVIVWVRTTPETAASRIRARPSGNSRYERMPEAEIIARLEPAGRIYEQIIGLYRRHAATSVLEIWGEDPLSDNTGRIRAFLGETLPQHARPQP